MNIVKKIRRLALLLISTTTAWTVQLKSSHDEEHFDVMIDFAFPVHVMQSIRQDLNQSLYFIQQRNYVVAVPTLQDAVSKLHTRASMNSDDIAYIQAMIDQIHAFMLSSLEDCQERSAILEMCSKIQDFL